MENREDNHKTEQDEIVEVAPVESPSENILVIEQLRKMPPIFSRGLIYIVMLIFLIAFIYSLASKVDIVIECRSVARLSSPKANILSERNGYIEKIFISEGQMVEKETPLFLIRSKEGASYKSEVMELARFIPLGEEYYNSKISIALEKLRNLDSMFRNTIRAKELRLKQNNTFIEPIQSDIAYWQKEIEHLADEFEGKQRLFEKQRISADEYGKIRRRLDRARNEVDTLISKRNSISKENTIFEKEIAKASSTYENNRKVLEKDIEDLEMKKEATIQFMQNELHMNDKMFSLNKHSALQTENGKEKGNIVRANKAGMISDLYFENKGEYVKESDLLCTIIPIDSPLYMDITVANKDIGFIETDMEIKYKIEAFSFLDYGTLSGKVFWISPAGVEDRARGFIYHIKGTLDKPYFEIKEKKYHVRAGMTATAELITQKRSILTILFKKLKG